MKYYLDCEFDGHNGPLLSIALVPASERPYLYLVTDAVAEDPWVIENVVPYLHANVNGPFVGISEVGWHLRQYLKHDDRPVIVADSVVDIGRFCRALSTDVDGQWASFDGNINFEVHDVNCYPTTIPSAIQHNAFWDAMALRARLQGD